MIGPTERTLRAPVQEIDSVSNAYFELLENKSYRERTGRATADKDSVNRRIDAAIQTFSHVR